MALKQKQCNLETVQAEEKKSKYWNEKINQMLKTLIKDMPRGEEGRKECKHTNCGSGFNVRSAH